MNWKTFFFFFYKKSTYDTCGLQPRAGGGTGCYPRHNIGQDSNMEHLDEDGEGTVAAGLPAVIMMYNLIEGYASILCRTQTAPLLSMHYSA